MIFLYIPLLLEPEYGKGWPVVEIFLNHGIIIRQWLFCVARNCNLQREPSQMLLIKTGCRCILQRLQTVMSLSSERSVLTATAVSIASHRFSDQRRC
jgi:hypothetical protein